MKTNSDLKVALYDAIANKARAAVIQSGARWRVVTSMSAEEVLESEEGSKAMPIVELYNSVSQDDNKAKIDMGDTIKNIARFGFYDGKIKYLIIVIGGEK